MGLGERHWRFSVAAGLGGIGDLVGLWGGGGHWRFGGAVAWREALVI